MALPPLQSGVSAVPSHALSTADSDRTARLHLPSDIGKDMSKSDMPASDAEDVASNFQVMQTSTENDMKGFWKFWPLSGFTGPGGGHIKGLGVKHSWLTRADYDKRGEWTPTSEWEFFNLFCIKRDPGRTRWAVASVSLTFHRAAWRIGEREKARERRQSRRRLASLGIR